MQHGTNNFEIFNTLMERAELCVRQQLLLLLLMNANEKEKKTEKRLCTSTWAGGIEAIEGKGEGERYVEIYCCGCFSIFVE